MAKAFPLHSIDLGLTFMSACQAIQKNFENSNHRYSLAYQHNRNKVKSKPVKFSCCIPGLQNTCIFMGQTPDALLKIVADN